MVLAGTLEVAADDLPTMASLDASDLVLERAELLQVFYEVDAAELVTMLPPACQPTIPPTLTVAVVRCPDSELGPVTMAQVRIGCRSGIWPRNYLVSAVVEQPAAREALTAGWGFRCRPGRVRLAARHDRVQVVVEGDEGEVLRAALVDPQPISAGDLWYAPNLHLATTPRGVRLVHVDMQFAAVSRADRGRAEIGLLEAPHWGESRLGPSYPIAASHVIGDLKLSLVGLLNDPAVPGPEGVEKLG